MRLLLAGLFSFTMMLLSVFIIGWFYPDDRNWPNWVFPVILVVFFGSIFASMFIFNRPGERPVMPGKSGQEHIAEMEQKGLITAATYHAHRAFQVEEFEDEGLHFYLELQGGEVLYLNGQYLYDYEEIADDPDCNQSRKFPCSEFTVKRHKAGGYVVDLICGGVLLPVECVAPCFDKHDIKRGLLPEDGQIIYDRTYDQLKQERLKHRSQSSAA